MKKVKPKKIDIGDFEAKILKDIKKEIKDDYNIPNIDELRNDLKERIDINADIMDLFPDLEMAMEIVETGILSPNNALTVSLNYTVETEGIPSSIRTVISEKIRDYIKENYDLTGKLPDIVRKALFTKGAYTELIIPDSVIRGMSKYKYKLTTSMESFTADLTRKRKLSNILRGIENDDDVITVTDNFELLVATEAYEDYVNDVIMDSVLGTNTVNSYEAFSILDNAITKDTKPVLELEDNEIEKIGKPLIKEIDSTAVIPVCSKTDPSKHYGYFVILDDIGNPVTANTSTFGMKSKDILFGENTKQKSVTDEIIKKAKSLIQKKTKKPPKLNNMEEIAEYLIVKKMEKTLNNSLYRNLFKIELEGREELLEIVLERYIKEKRTNILFVPSEMLQYYAFKYRENGTGEGKLEKLTVLASMRALYVFVSMLSFIKSSIPMTRVDIELSEKDPNPRKSIEIIRSEVLKNREFSLPIGLYKIEDLVTWTHLAGFSFNYNHPQLPDVKVNISEETYEIKPIDTDFKEMIDKHIFLAMGTTPETVEASKGPNFATTELINNTIMVKRLAKQQKILNPQITEHIRKIIAMDGKLRSILTSIIEDNLPAIKKALLKQVEDSAMKEQIKKEDDIVIINYVLNKVIKSVTVSLPEPQNDDSENLGSKLSNYADEVEKVLDIILNEDYFDSDTIGDLSDLLTKVKSSIKAILVKDWMSKNGYMSEVSKLFTLDEDGKPILNVNEEFLSLKEQITKALLPLLEELKKGEKKIEEKIEKIDDKLEGNDEEDETSGEEDTNTGEENNTEDMNSDENNTGEEEGGEETTEEPEEGNTEEEPSIEEGGESGETEEANTEGNEEPEIPED